MLASQKFAGPVGRPATPVRADVAVVCGEKSFLLGHPRSLADRGGPWRAVCSTPCPLPARQAHLTRVLPTSAAASRSLSNHTAGPSRLARLTHGTNPHGYQSSGSAICPHAAGPGSGPAPHACVISRLLQPVRVCQQPRGATETESRTVTSSG